MAAHQAPPSLGFSRQEHWSGLLFPSPMLESEELKWSCSVLSNSSWPHGLQPTRLLRPWDFPGKSTGVGCHCLLQFCCINTQLFIHSSFSVFDDLKIYLFWYTHLELGLLFPSICIHSTLTDIIKRFYKVVVAIYTLPTMCESQPW